MTRNRGSISRDGSAEKKRIQALETQNASTGIQAKLQFQTQIVAFMLQRRFRHAMMRIFLSPHFQGLPRRT